MCAAGNKNPCLSIYTTDVTKNELMLHMGVDELLYFTENFASN